MSASPVSALFEPRAVLSSMNSLGPERYSSEEAAIVLICPLEEFDRGVLKKSHRSGQRSRHAEARAARRHIEERLVLVGAGADEFDLARIIERRRRHLVRR